MDGITTRSSLLEKVRNLADQRAWVEFVNSYSPLLRTWCGQFGIDPELADELCQLILIELMNRMPSFRYDPSGSFRGWLKTLFRFRAINLLKKRRREVAHLLETDRLERAALEPSDSDEHHEHIRSLLQEAERVHKLVKDRTKPQRWEAYWRIIILGEDIGATAAALAMPYGSAYAASRYVDGVVRAQAQKIREENANKRMIAGGE